MPPSWNATLPAAIPGIGYPTFRGLRRGGLPTRHGPSGLSPSRSGDPRVTTNSNSCAPVTKTRPPRARCLPRTGDREAPCLPGGLAKSAGTWVGGAQPPTQSFFAPCSPQCHQAAIRLRILRESQSRATGRVDSDRKASTRLEEIQAAARHIVTAASLELEPAIPVLMERPLGSYFFAPCHALIRCLARGR